MNYIVICESQSITYLLMTELKEGGHAIAGFTSKEDVMKSFKGYTDAWTGGVERSASACIGMMNMQPRGLEISSIEELMKYLPSKDKLVHVSGGAMGRGYVGMLIDKKILELPHFEVWKESMELAGV